MRNIIIDSVLSVRSTSISKRKGTVKIIPTRHRLWFHSCIIVRVSNLAIETCNLFICSLFNNAF
jgi:hypothetical protein